MRIKFVHATHQYFAEIDGKNKELISVSEFVKSFEQPKDWKLIATKYAKKNGQTAAYWQKQWKDKAAKSTVAGTIFHAQREQETIDNQFAFEGKKCKTRTCEHIGETKWGIPITNLEPNTIYPELIIYDVEYMICGQADKTIVTDTHINVGDYKTDKEIKFKGYSSIWKEAEKLKPPVAHLEHCNGNLYALKMSLYMYMLWKQNKHLSPGKLFIEHITLKRDEEGIPILDKNNKPIVLEENIIEVPYLKKEVMAMLKHYKKNQKKK